MFLINCFPLSGINAENGVIKLLANDNTPAAAAFCGRETTEESGLVNCLTLALLVGGEEIGLSGLCLPLIKLPPSAAALKGIIGCGLL